MTKSTERAEVRRLRTEGMYIKDIALGAIQQYIGIDKPEWLL
jgi:hypothetical protein